jgi:hypothetical protein
MGCGLACPARGDDRRSLTRRAKLASFGKINVRRPRAFGRRSSTQRLSGYIRILRAFVKSDRHPEFGFQIMIFRDLFGMFG